MRSSGPYGRGFVECANEYNRCLCSWQRFVEGRAGDALDVTARQNLARASAVLSRYVARATREARQARKYCRHERHRRGASRPTWATGFVPVDPVYTNHVEAYNCAMRAFEVHAIPLVIQTLGHRETYQRRADALNGAIKKFSRFAWGVIRDRDRYRRECQSYTAQA